MRVSNPIPIVVIVAIILLAILSGASSRAEQKNRDSRPLPLFSAPDGCVVQKVAGQPLINYPLFACFDDEGRLYVAEGTGLNVPGTELVKKKLGRITWLEDTDGDGRFDKSTLFADQLVFPGLEKSLTAQELSDLLEFLYSRR